MGFVFPFSEVEDSAAVVRLLDPGKHSAQSLTESQPTYVACLHGDNMYTSATAEANPRLSMIKPSGAIIW